MSIRLNTPPQDSQAECAATDDPAEAASTAPQFIEFKLPAHLILDVRPVPEPVFSFGDRRPWAVRVANVDTEERTLLAGAGPWRELGEQPADVLEGVPLMQPRDDHMSNQVHELDDDAESTPTEVLIRDILGVLLKRPFFFVGTSTHRRRCRRCDHGS